MKKKILTEQRLRELAGLIEVGPTGTQTWDPRSEREPEEEDPDATQELAPVQEPDPQIRKDLNKILTALSTQMEREKRPEAKEVVDWLNSDERTPYGTMSEPFAAADGQMYIHRNVYNPKYHVELPQSRALRIDVGHPLDGGFPKDWSARQRQAARAVWRFIHNREGFRASQEVAQLVNRITRATRGEKYPSRVPALDVSSWSPEAQKLIALLDRPDDAQQRGL